MTRVDDAAGPPRRPPTRSRNPPGRPAPPLLARRPRLRPGRDGGRARGGPHRDRDAPARRRAGRVADAPLVPVARPRDDRDAGPRRRHQPHPARRARRPAVVERRPGQPPRPPQLLVALPHLPGTGRLGVEPARRGGRPQLDRHRTHPVDRPAPRRHGAGGRLRRRPRGARPPLRHDGPDRAVEPLPAGDVVDAHRRRAVGRPLRRPSHAARGGVRGVLLPADPHLVRHPGRRLRRRGAGRVRGAGHAPARRPPGPPPPARLVGARAGAGRGAVVAAAHRPGDRRPRQHVDRRRPLHGARRRARRARPRRRAVRRAPQPLAAARRAEGDRRIDRARPAVRPPVGGRRARHLAPRAAGGSAPVDPAPTARGDRTRPRPRAGLVDADPRVRVVLPDALGVEHHDADGDRHRVDGGLRRAGEGRRARARGAPRAGRDRRGPAGVDRLVRGRRPRRRADPGDLLVDRRRLHRGHHVGHRLGRGPRWTGETGGTS